MSINDFIETVTNTHVKRLLVKKLNTGCNLIVNKNDSLSIRGRYVVGHGGFTITEV